jgi:hypothetical protein
VIFGLLLVILSSYNIAKSQQTVTQLGEKQDTTINQTTDKLVNASNSKEPTLQQGQEVVPIQWKNFVTPQTIGKEEEQSRRIFANAVRYNLTWITQTFKKDEQRQLFILKQYDEQGVRPAASVCYAVATALKVAELNENELGVPRQEAFNLVKKLIKGVVAAYKKNKTDGKGWGYQWQSAHWATFAGQGAWIIWDDLDKETQTLVLTMITEEADRFIVPNYRVPYWTSPNGHVNTPGDTKAEENAWNAGILMVALAMMPNHPHAKQWKQVCSELVVSAFAVKSDLQNNRIIDGKPVKEWLHGYNLRDDGMVDNHRRIHPDYTSAVTINTRTLLIQPLAGQPVFEGATLNFPLIYRTFVDRRWESPPYTAPGGTIYIPNQAEVYYPQGTDWSKYRFDIYYLLDVNAYLCKPELSNELKNKAVDWLRLRADRIEKMQNRNQNGKMFLSGEFDNYSGCEQMTAWQLADAYLLFWLSSHHKKTKN